MLWAAARGWDTYQRTPYMVDFAGFASPGSRQGDKVTYLLGMPAFMFLLACAGTWNVFRSMLPFVPGVATPISFKDATAVTAGFLICALATFIVTTKALIATGAN